MYITWHYTDESETSYDCMIAFMYIDSFFSHLLSQEKRNHNIDTMDDQTKTKYLEMLAISFCESLNNTRVPFSYPWNTMKNHLVVIN